MKTPPYKGYLTRSQLGKRPGWSNSVIDQLMPIADKVVANRYYKTQPPTRLYVLSRVEAIEQNPNFQQQLVKTENRKAAAAKAVASKQAALLAYVAALVIDVPTMPVAELTKQACAHYNQRKEAKWRGWQRGDDSDDWNLADPESDPTFLARISLNYLRHKLTDYDAQLRELAGRTGVDDACIALKAHVNAAITTVYPHLTASTQQPIDQEPAP